MKTKKIIAKKAERKIVMAERKFIMSKTNCRNDFFNYLEEAGENLFSEFPQSWDDEPNFDDIY